MPQECTKSLTVRVFLDGRVEVKHDGMDVSEAVNIARALLSVLSVELEKRMQSGLVLPKTN